MSHRSASRSYTTIGSPLLAVSQVPPKPDQTDEMGIGPRRDVPVSLSKTWRPTFTISTYWAFPTAPLVSGGLPTLHPTHGFDMPAHCRMAPGTDGSALSGRQKLF